MSTENTELAQGKVYESLTRCEWNRKIIIEALKPTARQAQADLLDRCWGTPPDGTKRAQISLIHGRAFSAVSKTVV